MIFRGMQIQATRKRIEAADRDPGKHYYELRHGDRKGTPYSVEKDVWVNFWGTIESDVPLEFEGNCIDLTEEERRMLCGTTYKTKIGKKRGE